MSLISSTIPYHPEPRIITIPFRKDMEDASVKLNKHCTTRSEVYGVPGDIFYLRARPFMLRAIEQTVIRHVAEDLWTFEGMRNHAEFLDVWNQLHPKKQYNPDDQTPRYAHWFSMEGHDIPKVECWDPKCGRMIYPWQAASWIKGAPFCEHCSPEARL